ncbi:MAG: hypothetical protein ACLQVI_42760 [Polyangiaceae bacterium]
MGSRVLALISAILAFAPDAGAVDFPPPAPAGALIAPGRLRPGATPPSRRVCSLREPLCVHGDVTPKALLGVLASAERAWEVETQALALPEPDADPETAAYDLYVMRGVPEGTVTLAGARDPRSPVDRASAYTLFDASLALGESCARDTAVAESVARASLFRAAPATDEGSARAEASYFARLAVPCAMTRLGDIDAFQRSPERAIADPFASGDVADSAADARFDRGASLFYWWIDASFSATPGGLPRALWALSPTTTPLGADRWNDEPDGFDVLRASFKDVISSGSRIEDLFAEFGATRALLGARENGAELPESRPLGAAIEPRIDWTIGWPATPRRLASPLPLAPTGSAYVLVSHAGAPAGARLRVEAAWEQHAAIRWTVVKLDAAGRELGRIPIAAPPRATEAQATIIDLDAAASLLVVATNVGDPYVPFDPDDERFEPHGWLVTLAAE